jgi:diaminopimelate decarboxylase
MGAVAPITVRVNPDVDAKTHEKIATGRYDNKFGIPISRAREVYAGAARLPGIEVVGIDVHIGSQLTDLAPFEAAYLKVAELTRTLRADGHDIRRLDLGGGLGIPYERSNAAPPLPVEYGALIRRTVGDLGCEIEIEPGRLIAGNAGLLVAEVVYLKHGEGRDFLILDAAMNDLVRPAMYGAWHDIVPVREAPAGVDLAPGRRGGAGLRDGRHLRPRPPHAAAGRRRPRRLPFGRGLRGGDVVGIQHAAAHPRGDGQGRSLCGHPPTTDL